MSEELVVRSCAPTLAGLKVGNLFSCAFDDEMEANQSITRLNQKLSSKGICVVPLRTRDKRMLIYLYRPKKLRDVLSQEYAREILGRYGYQDLHPARCVKRLSDRIIESVDFPHEIGLFLGYPPEDVLGFIEHKARDYKWAGYWKVYGDVDSAKATVCRYKKCTAVYQECYRMGRDIEQLTVAI